MRLEPGTIVDRYRVEALLGEGGMAAVYRVRHEQLGRSYALKVLKFTHDDVRRRLLQEGRVQATLKHPNIATVNDVVMIGGTPGLVMEFVEGAALETLLADGRLSLRQADHLARGILAGVEAAHQAGLIHRDLKPANILLALDHRDQFVPKITDFGLAKVLDDAQPKEATRPGVGFGTPAYMAPEQIRDASSVDHRADIFSLGALLYELVTGRRCFPGDDVLDVLNRVAGAEYVPITTYAPDLPQHLVDAIDGALQIHPDDRWQDVRDLVLCWKQEESDFDLPFGLETSQRMRVLGAGVVLPTADGPTDLRPETPPPTRPRSELTTRPPPPEPERRPRKTGLWLGLGLSTLLATGGGVVLAVALLIAGGIALRTAQSPVPSPTLPPPSTPVLAAVPDPLPAPVPAPAAVQPHAPRPAVPSPAPAVEPTEIAPPPSETVPAPGPSVGSVYVSGDVEAWLVTPDGTRREVGGRVLPDTYVVEAVFPKDGRVRTNVTFDLQAGDIVNIDCDGAFALCERR